MKVIFFLVILCVVVAQIQAQCHSRSQNCRGGRNEGRGGRGCIGTRSWYYNGRECIEFHYRGCGGNNNRYCSKADCDQRCRR